MVCATCGKPLRFEAVLTLPLETPDLEPIMCPYAGHDAGKRSTVGWWRSFTISPEEQETWLAGNVGVATSIGDSG
jgi:DNA-directed RNA polymerase subunit RPC12/RpoP